MSAEIACCHHRAPGGQAGVLLVMLPGVGIEAGAFAAQGMVAAVHDRGLGVDIIAAQPDAALYLDGDVASVLHRRIIEPARAKGYSRIWLLGISLGGMGALLYASIHEALLEGIILLAPFIGTQGTIAGIERAGGLAGWVTTSTAIASERAALGWLQNFIARPDPRLQLYLGYGQADRFARGHRMLGRALPVAQVVTDAGGHDWAAWLALWRGILDTGLFERTP